MGKEVVSKKVNLNSENEIRIREETVKIFFFRNSINQIFRIPMSK